MVRTMEKQSVDNRVLKLCTCISPATVRISCHVYLSSLIDANVYGCSF